MEAINKGDKDRDPTIFHLIVLISCVGCNHPVRAIEGQKHKGIWVRVRVKLVRVKVEFGLRLVSVRVGGFKGIRGRKTNGSVRKTSGTDKRQNTDDKEARKTDDNGLISYIRTSALLFSIRFFLFLVWVTTILYPPLKGKNMVMNEQDKNNTDHAVAETVDTDSAPPAEVTVENEAEAAASAEVTVEKETEVAPPPAEVIDQTKRT